MATIYLDGTNFSVNGQALSYGDKLSDFVPLVDSIIDFYTGTITGTLEDGSSLNNIFEIYKTGTYAGTADIIIIPEPATLLLFGLGGLVLRRKNS